MSGQRFFGRSLPCSGFEPESVRVGLRRAVCPVPQPRHRCVGGGVLNHPLLKLVGGFESPADRQRRISIRVGVEPKATLDRRDVDPPDLTGLQGLVVPQRLDLSNLVLSHQDALPEGVENNENESAGPAPTTPWPPPHWRSPSRRPGERTEDRTRPPNAGIGKDQSGAARFLQERFRARVGGSSAEGRDQRLAGRTEAEKE